MIDRRRTGRRLTHALLYAWAAFGASLCIAAAPATKLQAVAPAAAPPLELKDTTGRSYRLSDYRGKVVLVNFWATWCEPCRNEMPAMQALENRFGERAGGHLVVLAVNHGESAARIGQFVQAIPLRFPILQDGFSVAWRTWNPRMLPASYLVGRDGKVRYRVLGEFDWAGTEAVAAVRKLLAEKPQ